MSIFSTVKVPKVKKSTFNLSHERKLSMNFGSLVPILCEEVLPNDTFKINTELLIKMAPLKAPVMHRLNATVHYFFVPTYQVWEKFEDFINPAKTQDTVPPYLNIETVCFFLLQQYCLSLGLDVEEDFPSFFTHWTGYLFTEMDNEVSFPDNVEGVDFIIGSIFDYFGIDLSSIFDRWINGGDELTLNDCCELLDPKISSLPFRAYAHIWNEYYRDQNLSSEIEYGIEDGALGSDAFTLNIIKICYRAWKKDYFTSALPTPQAGDDVLLPLGGKVPVNFAVEGTNPAEPGNVIAVASGRDVGLQVEGESGDRSIKGTADLGAVPGVSISELRKSVALQRFKEITMTGGKSRYKELVRSLFGAFLPDYYVDRPIFLGGQVQPISIGEVVQTSMSVEDQGDVAALGSRAGLAQSFGKTKTVFQKFPCHGYIIGLLSIRPEATYQQGLHRMWTRRSLFDYAFPQFAHIGEQEIKNKELVFSQDPEYNEGVFGYAPRYAEYKVGESIVCGQFRKSLDYWHFGRKFDNSGTLSPKLNEQFIMMSPEQMDYDPFAVTDPLVEHVYVDLYNHITARRPLPYFGTPRLI